MTDFQSEFVFGLQGKRYQDFITGVAKPEIEKVLGTSDYEIIGFEGHFIILPENWTKKLQQIR